MRISDCSSDVCSSDLCDATLGPGATNLVTALVESYNAGVPLIAITGDTHRAHSWKNMTQECRQLDILRPAVKDIIRVELVERIPELVRRAYAIRSEEHTSELQSLMRISYAVFCLKKKKQKQYTKNKTNYIKYYKN